MYDGKGTLFGNTIWVGWRKRMRRVSGSPGSQEHLGSVRVMKQKHGSSYMVWYIGAPRIIIETDSFSAHNWIQGSNVRECKGWLKRDWEVTFSANRAADQLAKSAHSSQHRERILLSSPAQTTRFYNRVFWGSLFNNIIDLFII